MKGIKIQIKEDVLKITVDDDFIVIEKDEQEEIENKDNNKAVRSKGKKETKYQAQIVNGKKKWILKPKYRQLAYQKAKKRIKEKKRLQETKDKKYLGLVKLNQLDQPSRHGDSDDFNDNGNNFTDNNNNKNKNEHDQKEG